MGMIVAYNGWITFTPNGKNYRYYWYRNKYKKIYRTKGAERARKLKELSKDRVMLDCIIKPLEQERIFKERYVNYNTLDNVRLRQEQFKLYYLSNDMTIDEVKAEELERMLESYYRFKEVSKKAFYNWVKYYVVIDYELLKDFINITSTTEQQRGRKLYNSFYKAIVSHIGKTPVVEVDDYIKEDRTKVEVLEIKKEMQLEEYDRICSRVQENHIGQVKGFLDSIATSNKVEELQKLLELIEEFRIADIKAMEKLMQEDAEARE